MANGLERTSPIDIYPARDTHVLYRKRTHGRQINKLAVRAHNGRHYHHTRCVVWADGDPCYKRTSNRTRRPATWRLYYNIHNPHATLSYNNNRLRHRSRSLKAPLIVRPYPVAWRAFGEGFVATSARMCLVDVVENVITYYANGHVREIWSEPYN